MLISENLRDALSIQLASEKSNANIYLYICGYLRNKGMDGIAKKFLQQHQEETEHSLQIFDLLTDLNADVAIGEIEEVNLTINSVADIANAYLQKEIETTESLNELKQLAISEDNCVVEEFLRKMIAQQQHELMEATSFMDKVQLLGNDWKFIALWDATME